jgi:hypothetical protein
VLVCVESLLRQEAGLMLQALIMFHIVKKIVQKNYFTASIKQTFNKYYCRTVPTAALKCLS